MIRPAIAVALLLAGCDKTAAPVASDDAIAAAAAEHKAVADTDGARRDAARPGGPVEQN